MATVFDRRRPDPTLGVFETLLVIDSRPVELDAHLARLSSSLAELFPHRRAPALADALHGRARGIQVGALRVTAAPDSDTGLRAEVESRGSCGDFMSLSGRKAPMGSVGLVSLPLVGGLGSHKWADRSLLDEAQAELDEDALPLIVDCDGAVLEASRANVFVVRDSTLLTPPTDGRILPGVTRMRVLEIADAVGLETHEAELARDDLLSADEVLLTGSVRGIERARSLDGTPLPARGDVGSRIADRLRQTWLGAHVG